jgi:sphingomyelin phosphodiesterase 2
MKDYLRVMSLNLWGLGFNISQDREARVRALGEAFSQLEADLFTLQEVWLESDQKYLIRQAEGAGLLYSHSFRSGIIGSGLVILSRYRIMEAQFRPYRLRSRPELLTQGDYYAFKGAAVARLATPYGPIDCYNTHAIAQYAPDYQDELAAQRAANMYELGQFVNQYSHSTPAIVTGDFNVNPHQLGYRLLLGLTGLVDCYDALHPDDPSITFSLDNPYNSNYREPERIDYICVRSGGRLGLTPQAAGVTLKQRPDYPYKPYSDHYAVQVDFDIELLMNQHPLPPREAAEELPLLQEFAKCLQTGLEQAMARKQRHLLHVGAALALSLALNPGRAALQVEALRRLGRSWLAALALIYALLRAGLYGLMQAEEISALKALLAEVRLRNVALQISERSEKNEKEDKPNALERPQL